ncbi:MAG TPA: hypothetical protein VKI61_08595 [Chitinophagaceae bacterium]|jgi:hypothetical protein|nr:hypothetical protein [Chitinophagaceae bacterium]
MCNVNENVYVSKIVIAVFYLAGSLKLIIDLLYNGADTTMLFKEQMPASKLFNHISYAAAKQMFPITFAGKQNI